MGYRWYKGRFLSDDEYYSKLNDELQTTLKSAGLTIPLLLIGWLGYLIANEQGAIIGGLIGGIIGLMFNSFFSWLAGIILFLLLILVILGAVVLIITVVIQTYF